MAAMRASRLHWTLVLVGFFASTASVAQIASGSTRAWIAQVDGVLSGEAIEAGRLEVAAHRLEGYLIVEVRSPAPQSVALCLGRGEVVTALVADAGLHSRRYRGGGTQWHLQQAISPLPRGEVEPSRGMQVGALADLFEVHGWVASPAGMGVPGHTEFVVGPELAGADRFAVAVLAEGEPLDALTWPDGGPAGCSDRRLPEGAVLTLDFGGGDWLPLH